MVASRNGNVLLFYSFAALRFPGSFRQQITCSLQCLCKCLNDWSTKTFCLSCQSKGVTLYLTGAQNWKFNALLCFTYHLIHLTSTYMQYLFGLLSKHGTICSMVKQQPLCCPEAVFWSTALAHPASRYYAEITEYMCSTTQHNRSVSLSKNKSIVS